mmetsp:Transcript_22976/g.25513  ORF Transcript_22976/g.25513 Transcript_22976/m.25513 type:complete len:192 (+) Transcript_22976:91-666(+)
MPKIYRAENISTEDSKNSRTKISFKDRITLEAYFKYDPCWQKKTRDYVTPLVNLGEKQIYKWGYDKRRTSWKTRVPMRTRRITKPIHLLQLKDFFNGETDLNKLVNWVISDPVLPPRPCLVNPRINDSFDTKTCCNSENGEEAKVEEIEIRIMARENANRERRYRNALKFIHEVKSLTRTSEIEGEIEKTS